MGYHSLAYLYFLQRMCIFGWVLSYNPLLLLLQQWSEDVFPMLLASFSLLIFLAHAVILPTVVMGKTLLQTGSR